MGYAWAMWAMFCLVLVIGEVLRWLGVEEDVVMEFIITCGFIFLAFGAEYLGLLFGVPLGISPHLSFFFGFMVEIECIRIIGWYINAVVKG